MSERLRSVGLDVGTTSTQLIFSELTVENRASGFSVPEMEITERKLLYSSPVHFTPLLNGQLVDTAALRQLVEAEYRAAGMDRRDVDTGAIIITGETSRKENARAVLEALADLAGEFVVATAGPDLESCLAARGAGAVDYGERTGKPVIHMDIGGGTSNFARIQDGKIRETTCLNVGGRLIIFDKAGIITYVSPVLEGLCHLKPGDKADAESLMEVARILAQALEMASGLREPTDLLHRLTTKETAGVWRIPEKGVISFSGGVADCIREALPWDAFGDLGPVLGQAIRESRLCRGEYVLGRETIRATVIGAGCHSTQLSGSTVYHRNVSFPLKNVPVIHPEMNRESIRRQLQTQEGPAVLAFEGICAPGYAQVVELAELLLEAVPQGPVLVCLEQDMAKALGQAIALRSDPRRPVLCLDRIRVGEGSYLDIGAPVGPALPVVVKTLVLGK